MRREHQYDYSYKNQYFTIKNLYTGTERNTFSILKKTTSAPTFTIQYSLDYGATWNSLDNSQNIYGGFVNEVWLKGNIAKFSNNDTNFCYIDVTRDYEVCGNIMSLYYGDDFYDKVAFPGSNTYSAAYMFSDEKSTDKLKSAKNLIIPAESVTQNALCYMFKNQKNLTDAPQLPMKTIGRNAFYGMFYGCSGLINPPNVLCATTSSVGEYYSMFENCKSLQRAPEIKMITGGSSSLRRMFYGCSSLKYAPSFDSLLTVGGYCCMEMFRGCSRLVYFPSLPAETLGNYCYSNMFRDCTSLYIDEGVKLPATTLKNYCYQSMFQECQSIEIAPTLPAKTLISNCYTNMFYNCKNLRYIEAMFLTTPSTTYTNDWVYGVESYPPSAGGEPGIFVKNPEATWNVSGVYGIPEKWTVRYS